jgi:hypothetical protein
VKGVSSGAHKTVVWRSRARTAASRQTEGNVWRQRLSQSADAGVSGSSIFGCWARRALEETNAKLPVRDQCLGRGRLFARAPGRCSGPYNNTPGGPDTAAGTAAVAILTTITAACGRACVGCSLRDKAQLFLASRPAASRASPGGKTTRAAYGSALCVSHRETL